MTAFIKLLEFISKLPEEIQPEYKQLIDNYADERDRLQNERLANSITYDVVAIAGTSEQLLTNPIQTIEGC